MSLPDPLPIRPFTHPVRGEITLPGSKSITNRALLLAALSEGPVTLTNALFSRDTEIMAAALNQLGIAVAVDARARTMHVAGAGGRIPVPSAKLSVGNAGTAARFLTALVCLRDGGVYHFDGDEAMRRRPIGPLLDALESQGARASARSFPFTLQTAGLSGGAVEIDAAESSQLLSALLLIAPQARSPLSIRLKGGTVSKPFIAMTERMLEAVRRAPRDLCHRKRCIGRQLFSRPPPRGRRADRAARVHARPQPAGRRGICGGAGKNRVERGGTARMGGVGSPPSRPDGGFQHLLRHLPHPRRDRPAARRPDAKSPASRTRANRRPTASPAWRASCTKLGQHVSRPRTRSTSRPRPLRRGVDIETYHDHRFAMSFGILGCHDLHGDGRPGSRSTTPPAAPKPFPHFFEFLGGSAPKVALRLA